MNLIEKIILAFVLSVDASIVAFSNGLTNCEKKISNSVVLAFFLGFFQFLMPIIGYFLTGEVSKYISQYSKWLVFGIFMFLGVKFIKDAFNPTDNNCNKIFSFKYILLVSIATSIDAFGAGVLLALQNNSIILPSILIGIITFTNCLICFWISKIFILPKKNLIIISGILLILLGIKSLF